MQKFSAENVKAYYDKLTSSYLDIYGDVIQAFRPSKKKDLLRYIAQSSGLKRGMKILDAGCGVGGPAIYFASEYKVRVDALTISPVQVEEAKLRVAEKNLGEYVHVSEGDYHHLDNYYAANSYDAVYFLESLGHAAAPEQVITKAYQSLKPGGYIYIKDFYRKISEDVIEQQKIDKVIQNINQSYSYNTLDLHELLYALRKCGFEILFIKNFDFKDDTSIRAAFEQAHQIDVFEGMDEFWPAEWLEIKCRKP